MSRMKMILVLSTVEMTSNALPLQAYFVLIIIVTNKCIENASLSYVLESIHARRIELGAHLSHTRT